MTAGECQRGIGNLVETKGMNNERFLMGDLVKWV